MRIKSVWRAGVLAVLAALAVLAPGKALAQESWPQGGFATGYAPPAVQLPYPLYSTHPEMGGLFSPAPTSCTIRRIRSGARRSRSAASWPRMIPS